MYHNQEKKIKQEPIQWFTQQKGKYINDFRLSDTILKKTIKGIHSSLRPTSIIQGVFKKEDDTYTAIPHVQYNNLSHTEKAIFDILKEKERTITLNDNASLNELKKILITNITDHEFIVSQGYVFTHETNDIVGISKDKAIKGRASTIGVDSRSSSDATRTGVINPVFTRLTSAMSYRTAKSGSTGRDRSILIVISPLAFLRDNPLVPGSELAGCYNEDVGKTGNRRNVIEPKVLADSKAQSSSNEQHWVNGIDLSQNAIGIAIKVKGSKENNSLTLYKGNTLGNTLKNTDVLNEVDLLKFGDSSVKDAVSESKKISSTLIIKGININYPLKELHTLF